MYIVLWEPSFMQTGGRTDELTGLDDFRNFAKTCTK
jgi:hypothetical protein